MKNNNKLIEKLRLFEEEMSNREVLHIKSDQGNLYIHKDRIVMITAEHVYSYIEYMVDEKINGIGVLERSLVRKS